MKIWPTKRGWKRIAIGLTLLVAVALVVNGLLAWRAEWKLRSRLAAIRAAGDPASIAELAPAAIPDDENAAAIMEAVTPRLDEFSTEYSRWFDSPLGKDYDERLDRDEPPTKEQMEAIREILAKYPDVEQSIAKAAACEQFASRLDFSVDHSKFIEQLIDHVQDGRTAARFLAWRGEVLLADGQYEQAVQNGILALRLARLHEKEPTLVAFLVAIAMRGYANFQIYDALAAGPISPAVHQALDQELARQEDPKRFARVLKSERAVSSDWIHAQTNAVPTVIAHMFAWPLKAYQAGAMDAMAEYIQLAELPWSEVRYRLGMVGPKAEIPSSGHGVLADLLIPALQAAYQANARDLATSRALRIDNALREFAEKNGREANGLEELQLPAEAVMDPFSGKPLKLKHVPEGWVVYSVMNNEVDDGGDFIELKDYGVAPARLRQTEKPEPAAGSEEST